MSNLEQNENIEFRPYKFIKDFPNISRNISPANRDFVLNSIFLGRSTGEQGTTLLDTQDHGFMDLWIYIINAYKQSVFETQRGELIVVPDIMSCLPPLCNIIFPDQYLHYGRSVKLRNIPTRYISQGFVTQPGLTSSDGLDSQIALSSEAFVAPTSDIVPEITDTIKGECTGRKVDDEFSVFSQIPLDEEFHYGSTTMTDSGEYLFKAGESAVRSGSNNATPNDGESSLNLAEEYNNYHKLNVLYRYFLSRLQSQKTENIEMIFNPNIIPGFPILLLSRSGRHIFGLLSAMEHSISAEGFAKTYITVEYQYLYDDVSKRPLYLYRDRNKEQNLFKNDDSEDQYVWKNYFMLSDYFRDKFIGSKMYKTILTDGINKEDYSYDAIRFSQLNDVSILGIHDIIKDYSLKKKN